MNDSFLKSNFAALPTKDRQALCSQLAKEIARRTALTPSLHDEVKHIVEALRALGHDLWSYDESDEFEIWGPNYITPSGPGIVLTIRRDNVQVEWINQ